MAQRGRSAVSVAQLLEAGFIRAGQEVRLRGPSATRAVITSNGGIALGGEEYRSPSTAARAARGGTSTNGWAMWQIESDGNWVDLADVRGRWLSQRDPA